MTCFLLIKYFFANLFGHIFNLKNNLLYERLLLIFEGADTFEVLADSPIPPGAETVLLYGNLRLADKDRTFSVLFLLFAVVCPLDPGDSSLFNNNTDSKKSIFEKLVNSIPI